MAAPSPVLSSNSSNLASTTVAATSSAATASSSINSVRRMETTPKTLRGLNKPKCRVCGNVARSRCPYESCKSCCSKNQNPCHIHVLKANATFQDKTPTSNSPLFDQQSTEPSPSGSSLRMASFRQLSSNFAQFNNVHISLRSRKPLSRKDAAAINEWRFSKLREYQERNIEAEDEAFDRYIQNVGLLEEIFSMKSAFEGSVDDSSSSLNPNTLSEDKSKVMVSESKFKLLSNMGRSDNSRKRMQKTVDEGLNKFRKRDSDGVEQLTDQNDLSEGPKMAKTERVTALSELLDKLNKARNKEDFKSCLAMKSQLFNPQRRSGSTESEEIDITQVQASKDELENKKESTFSMPKFFCTTEIDQDTLNKIDVHFSSLEEIDNL